MEVSGVRVVLHLVIVGRMTWTIGCLYWMQLVEDGITVDAPEQRRGYRALAASSCRCVGEAFLGVVLGGL